MNYTPETWFLYSSRILTDSVARNPVSRDIHLHETYGKKPSLWASERAKIAQVISNPAAPE
ncbi:hypothetical protein [Microcoleus sp. B3-A4]|uniref:hypothetical protein n=1 Tax=Microcoleus sp. B3-A4 TaxID=2818653 RepID=UPI002FD0226D